MIRTQRNPFPAAAVLCCLASFLMSVPTSAQYVEIFSEAEAIADPGVASTILHNVTVSGGTAYALLQVSGATDSGELVAFDGTGFTTIMDGADWTATGSTNDPFAINGSAVIGGVLRHAHSLDNVIYEIDLGTGAVSTAVDNITLSTGAGQAPILASLIAAYDVTSSGDIYAFNDPSGGSAAHQVLIIDGVTDAVSVEIPNADLVAAIGTSPVGGMAFGGGDLFLGSNANDEIVAWDTVADSASVALTTAQIEAVTDDIDDRVGFSDFFYAPDGLIYFYESDSDYILSFDPADPDGTIASVISETQLIAGPAGSDSVGQLAWWNGNIAWTRSSFGFYAIPEPTSGSLTLLGLAGLLGCRRK